MNEEFARMARPKLAAMRADLVAYGFTTPNGEELTDRGKLAVAILTSLIPTEDLASIAVIAAMKRGEL